jgi:transposase-like protein
MCPVCKNSSARVRKKGFYAKRSTAAMRIQRYHCRDCGRSFSDQTNRLSYREKKPHENQRLYRLLCSGVSQARAASILDLHRITVARKLTKLARFARRDQRVWGECEQQALEVQFDEMETFVHSKCKPVTLAIAVNKDTRQLIAIEAEPIPAKGPLAKIARKKYGQRRNFGPYAMRRMMEAVKTTYPLVPRVMTDRKSTYPKLVRDYFPEAEHIATKGRRGCVVGQGELKRGGFDPLFTLNHTAAMVRDNLKTMSRRTWCTVKRLDRLQDLLALYIHFHNRFVVQKIRSPRVCGDPIM